MTEPSEITVEASDIGLGVGVWHDELFYRNEKFTLIQIVWSVGPDRDVMYVRYESDRGTKLKVYND